MYMCIYIYIYTYTHTTIHIFRRRSVAAGGGRGVAGGRLGLAAPEPARLLRGGPDRPESSRQVAGCYFNVDFAYKNNKHN